MIGISYLRELFNLSMQDLADKLSISRQVVHQWESKKVSVADKRIKQISNMFKIPKKYIAKELTDLDKLDMQRIKLNNDEKNIKLKNSSEFNKERSTNEYSIFFNGVTWTCEVINEKEVFDYVTGKTPNEALEKALTIKEN